MRTYLLKPGTTPSFEERFAEGLTYRVKFSRLGALWHSEVGTLNQVIHVWPYKDFEERTKIGEEARKTGHWPPKTHEFIITQETKILQPAPFSPPLEEKNSATSTRSEPILTCRGPCPPSSSGGKR